MMGLGSSSIPGSADAEGPTMTNRSPGDGETVPKDGEPAHTISAGSASSREVDS